MRKFVSFNLKLLIAFKLLQSKISKDDIIACLLCCIAYCIVESSCNGSMINPLYIWYYPALFLKKRKINPLETISRLRNINLFEPATAYNLRYTVINNN